MTIENQSKKRTGTNPDDKEMKIGAGILAEMEYVTDATPAVSSATARVRIRFLRC